MVDIENDWNVAPHGILGCWCCRYCYNLFFIPTATSSSSSSAQMLDSFQDISFVSIVCPIFFIRFGLVCLSAPPPCVFRPLLKTFAILAIHRSSFYKIHRLLLLLCGCGCLFFLCASVSRWFAFNVCIESLFFSSFFGFSKLTNLFP